ncbi:hypothetical protein ACFLZB_00815 [Nanoarchaeota archaeon]
MAKGKVGGVLLNLILLFVLFLSLIYTVFDFGGKMFIGELIIVLFFLLLALVSLGIKAASGKNSGLFLLYGLNLINFVFIWGMTKEIVWLGLLVAILGFLIGMATHGKKSDDFDDSFDDFNVEEVEPVKSVKTEFEPGKYVASKTGKKFHAPKCDWAKRIKKKSQVWFDDKDEAKKGKYKACDCVK